METMNLIEDHLYLGSYSAADDVDSLTKLDIRYVLSVWNDEIRVKLDHITYKRIFVDDTYDTDLITYFPEAIDFISEAVNSGHNALVHCHAGRSRSATIVIAYLMQKHNWTFTETTDMVYNRRSVFPNIGFRHQLMVFEQTKYKLDAKNPAFRRVLVETLLNFRPFWTTRLVNEIDVYYRRRDEFEAKTEGFDAGPDCLCVDCGFKLFNKINIIENESRAESTVDDEEDCGWTYIEPQEWMTIGFYAMTDVSDRVVKCPQCKKELVYHLSYLVSYSCECTRHHGLDLALRCRIANHNFKVQELPKN